MHVEALVGSCRPSCLTNMVFKGMVLQFSFHFSPSKRTISSLSQITPQTFTSALLHKTSNTSLAPVASLNLRGSLLCLYGLVVTSPSARRFGRSYIRLDGEAQDGARQSEVADGSCRSDQSSAEASETEVTLMVLVGSRPNAVQIMGHLDIRLGRRRGSAGHYFVYALNLWCKDCTAIVALMVIHSLRTV